MRGPSGRRDANRNLGKRFLTSLLSFDQGRGDPNSPPPIGRSSSLGGFRSKTSLNHEAAAGFHSRMSFPYFEPDIVAVAWHRVETNAILLLSDVSSIPNAALLSPRGKVLENGMPRFLSTTRRGRVRFGRFKTPHKRAGGLCHSGCSILQIR